MTGRGRRGGNHTNDGKEGARPRQPLGQMFLLVTISPREVAENVEHEIST